jgi:hypothetical protein
VVQHLDGQLFEAQCGFRSGRGTVDAIFTLQALKGACRSRSKRMVVAFVDFTKAYDSIDRAALWKVLEIYHVDPHIISLLRDLHTGTTAAVRLGGQVGRAFQVTAGVRQGCVIAPTLFNVFIDFILRKALVEMPEEVSSGIQFRTRAGGKVPESSIERIVMLLYADDLALMSHNPVHLAMMLEIVDAVASRHGLKINAAKTEIVDFNSDVTGDGATPLPPMQIAGGTVVQSDKFVYLGATQCANSDAAKEIAVRNARALQAMESFEKVWSTKKWKLATKMRVYKTYVLPHFLFGAEAWAATQCQTNILEHSHSHCLRRIMGATLTDRHSLQFIYSACGSEPLELMISRSTARWAGHVFRMDASRYPRQAFECTVDGGAPIGKAWSTGLRHYYKRLWQKSSFIDVSKIQMNSRDFKSGHWDVMWDELMTRAQDKAAWRNAVHGIRLGATPNPASPPRRNPRRGGG